MAALKTSCEGAPSVGSSIDVPMDTTTCDKTIGSMSTLGCPRTMILFDWDTATLAFFFITAQFPEADGCVDATSLYPLLWIAGAQ